MVNIAIFASGSGSNAEKIIKYFQEDNDICIKCIISNKSEAFVLNRAKKYNIEAKFFNKQDFIDCDNLVAYLEEREIDFIILAGFLLKVPAKLIVKYPNRIINIHPALLPKYGGKGMYGDNVHRAVKEAKEKETGITIHFVNEEYDKGAIIFQAETEIVDSDDYNAIADKVHKLEYEHFPRIIDETIKDFLINRTSLLTHKTD